MLIQKENMKSKPKQFRPEKGLFVGAPKFRQLSQIACIFFTKCSSYNKIFTLLKNSLLTSLQAEIEGGGAKGLPASFGWQKAQPLYGLNNSHYNDAMIRLSFLAYF